MLSTTEPTSLADQWWALGIDPGMGGGWAVLDASGCSVCHEPMPTLDKVFDVHRLAADMRAIKRRARDEGATIAAFLEAAAARPGQGVSTMFKFGRVYGMSEMVLAALKIPYELVSPSKWSATMLAGVEGGEKAKSRNIVAAKRLFPTVDMRSSARSKLPHEGIVDAYLIAEWGRRARLGLLPAKKRRS